MKPASRFGEEKGIERILLILGVLAAVVLLAVIIRGDLHKGEEVYPLVAADQNMEVVETDDGDLLLDAYDNELTAAESGEEVHFSLIVNINEASVTELMLLPGIGQTRAEAIIEFREMNGGFGSVEELLEIGGIGEKLYNDICGYCSVEGPVLQYKESHEEAEQQPED